MTAPDSGRRPLVGWYVHHHGSGHVTRLLAVRPLLDADVVVVSSLPRPAGLPEHTDWVELRVDNEVEDAGTGLPLDPATADPTAGGALHWAPLHHLGHRSRMSLVASIISDRAPDAMVVDVSVEVTALARLLGVPTVVVAQPGERDDAPHRLGRSLAEQLIAPRPSGVYPDVTPGLLEVGGVSRFDSRERTRQPEPGTVLVLGGRGGFDVTAADLDAARSATPHLTWSALGVEGSPWVDDPWDALCAAEVVISAAGQNSIADLAAADARAIVIPQVRPFGEQEATAGALGRAGLAIVPAGRPRAGDWAALVAAAASSRPDWSRWQTRGAAARMASAILDVARPASDPASSTAVITLCSMARLDHVLAQAQVVAGSPVRHIGVWLDAEPPPAIPGMTMLHTPPGRFGMRLAEGRNAGAAEATAGGATLLVFLDADCVPGERMLDRYEDAAAAHPDALLCGPVTYLAEGERDLAPGRLEALTSPHGARPSPPDGARQPATDDEYRLFWSLSFACTAQTWRASGGFHEGYEGYGAEDTDFGRSALDAGIPLVWVGGAHSYHQWHPTSTPPWAHLDDILRNAATYRGRWGETPMQGWLDAFASEGAIERRDGEWVRVDAARSA